jgi:hypothetical protein
MDRNGLTALRDAIDAVIALPDAAISALAALLPAPLKPNGHDRQPHPATVSAKPAMTGRKLTGMITDKMALAKAEEDKLILAIIANPGAGPKRLATLTEAKLNSTSERLNRLYRRGSIEKDASGKWRVIDAEDSGPRPTPPARPDPTTMTQKAAPPT